MRDTAVVLGGQGGLGNKCPRGLASPLNRQFKQTTQSASQQSTRRKAKTAKRNERVLGGRWGPMSLHKLTLGFSEID